jgi:hypothetical protein
MIKRLLILIVLMALGLGSWLDRPGPMRVALAVALLFVVLGSVIGWLAKQSTRLSSSGRDPRDFRDAYDGTYHPDR